MPAFTLYNVEWRTPESVLCAASPSHYVPCRCAITYKILKVWYLRVDDTNLTNIGITLASYYYQIPWKMFHRPLLLRNIVRTLQPVYSSLQLRGLRKALLTTCGGIGSQFSYPELLTDWSPKHFFSSLKRKWWTTVFTRMRGGGAYFLWRKWETRLSPTAPACIWKNLRCISGHLERESVKVKSRFPMKGALEIN